MEKNFLKKCKKIQQTWQFGQVVGEFSLASDLLVFWKLESPAPHRQALTWLIFSLGCEDGTGQSMKQSRVNTQKMQQSNDARPFGT